MMIHKNKIQHHFNRAADTYDENCHAQLRAGIKLTHLIKPLQLNAERILDLGCGTGMTTQILASQYHYRDFHAIDISTSLLMKAAQRLNPLGIQVYEMDFENVSCDKLSFDIIFSNMALQWSAHLLSTLTRIRPLLQTNGSLAFTIPLRGTFRELQNHYAINHFSDSETIHQLLLSSGYHVVVQYVENVTLSFPHAFNALKSIKQTGANYAYHRRHKGLSTKAHFKQFHTNELTYVIGYFIARKST